MKSLSLQRRIIGGAILGMVALLAVGLASLHSMNLMLSASRLTQHTYQVLNRLERIDADLNAARVFQRGYIITGDTTELINFEQELSQVWGDLGDLNQLLEGNPEQLHRAAELRVALEERVAEMRRRIELRRRAGTEAVANELLHAPANTKVNDAIFTLRTNEEAILANRLDSAQARAMLVRRSIQLGSGVALIILVAALVIVVREIQGRAKAYTLLHEREERLNDLMENATELINSVDESGHYIYVNRAWRERLKYDTSEAVRLHYRDVVAPDYRAAADDAFRRLLDGETLHGLKLELVARDGERVPVVGNASVRRDGIHPVVTRGIYRDVTEELAAERLKNQFLSVISHELRTPLTSIRGALGLLATGKLGTLNERGERMLSIAAEDTERLVRMVNDLLDVERLESGRVTLQKESVDLDALVQRASEIVQPLAERAGVQLETETVGVFIWADPDRILQTLTNLLDNAIKFSPQGSTVRVRTEVTDRKVRIAVIDHGRGVPSEMLERIFDRFQQIDASDARQKGGTGLGLAIAKMIVEQHGGNIWAESEGDGSTFSFTVPLAAAPTTQLSEPSGGPLILIAEDDRNAATVIGAMVEAHGFRVAYAADGVEALEQARNLMPDAVLLDLSMPRMSGAAALEELKSDPRTREIPVVIASGLAPGEVQIPQERLLDWLRKPLQESKLATALHRALANSVGVHSVLVVEDDSALANVLCSWLSDSGLRARHAATTQEAIELSAAEPPDIVVLDLLLPDGSGFEVAESLRETGRAGTPILVYSGVDLEAGERGRLTGNVEFMHKSRHDPNEVTHRIAMLLYRLAKKGETVGD